MQVAAVLRDARLSANLTQVELGACAGTSQATISAYESGRKEPSVATLSRLLAAAGARLTVQPARVAVTRRSWEQHDRPARGLVEALALAEQLPRRPARELRFPRLEPAQRRRAA